MYNEYYFYCSLGAAVVVDTNKVPDVFSQLPFNPLCFLLYENTSQFPEHWENVSRSYDLVIRSNCYNYQGQGYSYMYKATRLKPCTLYGLPGFLYVDVLFKKDWEMNIRIFAI